MKRTLIILLAMVAMAGCKKETVKPDEPFVPDPNAMVLIRGEQPTKGYIPGLTPLEIVEQGLNIRFTTHWSFVNDYEDIQRHIYYDEPVNAGRGFAEEHKDYDIPALKMWGTDIIGQNGGLVKDFLYSVDVYITDWNHDTIAHVPQAVIDNARLLIETAYHNQEYEEVYRLFDEVFTFRPIAGK